MSLILIVDGHANAQGAVARTLSAAGHVVVTVSSLVKAQAVLRRGGVDLVIADLVMSDGDGVSLIRSTKRNWPGMPIIATDDGGCAKRLDLFDIALRYGADAVVAEPFEPSVLMSNLNMLLESMQMPFGGFSYAG